VAPPESDKALAAEYFELRDRFGLSNAALVASAQEADEGDVEDEDEADPEQE
jgi:hypothetical protein